MPYTVVSTVCEKIEGFPPESAVSNWDVFYGENLQMLQFGSQFICRPQLCFQKSSRVDR